jgi:hypothetical protein
VAGKPAAEGATAGVFPLSALILFACVGLGFGWIAGYPVAGAVIGGALGIPVSFYLVYRQYRDL